MKKILGLIAALVLVMGCDDGEMSFNTFNFSSGTPNTCSGSNIYYKINGTEVLILDLSGNALVNVPTPRDEEENDIPRLITISGSNTITYRNYDGTPNSNSICSFPAPASPSVIEEWNGQGTISVITTEVRNSSNLITGYSHKITLLDVSFTKNGETTRIVNNDFGSIVVPIGFTFDFGDTEANLTAQTCPEKDLVFKRNSREALILDFAPGTFPTVPTEPGADPVTIPLDNLTDNNDVIFLVYDGSITNSHICDLIAPISPNISERWSAVSGRAEITTVEAPGGSGLQHQIWLYDVVFLKQSDNSGQTFRISDLILPDPDAPGYYFGVLND